MKILDEDKKIHVIPKASHHEYINVGDTVSIAVPTFNSWVVGEFFSGNTFMKVEYTVK